MPTPDNNLLAALKHARASQRPAAVAFRAALDAFHPHDGTVRERAAQLDELDRLEAARDAEHAADAPRRTSGAIATDLMLAGEAAAIGVDDVLEALDAWTEDGFRPSDHPATVVRILTARVTPANVEAVRELVESFASGNQ